MKILLVNKLFYEKGGAESVFFNTAKLLEEKGHRVSFFSMKDARNFPTEYGEYFVSNVDYDRRDLINAFKVAPKVLFSLEAAKKMERLIRDERPEIAHLHNIYHQLSPSILYPLKKRGIPVVMSLHDYKMTCGSYLLFFNGSLCEACAGGRYYNCLAASCLKGSCLKSGLAMLEMYLHHRILRVYDKVNMFISPSVFLKDKLETMGFTGRIKVLRHFVDAGSFEPSYESDGKTFVYFGRLSAEKGLISLLDAFSRLSGVTLKIIGDGPIGDSLKKKAIDERITNVRFLGHMDRIALFEELKRAMAIILPSECYETFGLSIAEGYALGKPVIASRVGALPEIVQDGVTGWLFQPGNVEDLCSKIALIVHDRSKAAEMGREARRFAENDFNKERYYESLMRIYEEAAGVK